MPIRVWGVGDDEDPGLFASPNSRRNDAPDAANVSHGQNERSTCIELGSRNGTLRNLDWFQVAEIRGHLEDGAIARTQVTVKIGFRLE